MTSLSKLPVILLLLLIPSISFAYFGPGGGLTAIGALLALIVAIGYTFIGFVWYPLKKWMEKFKNKQEENNSKEPELNDNTIDKNDEK